MRGYDTPFAYDITHIRLAHPVSLYQAVNFVLHGDSGGASRPAQRSEFGSASAASQKAIGAVSILLFILPQYCK